MYVTNHEQCQEVMCWWGDFLWIFLQLELCSFSCGLQRRSWEKAAGGGTEPEIYKKADRVLKTGKIWSTCLFCNIYMEWCFDLEKARSVKYLPVYCA